MKLINFLKVSLIEFLKNIYKKQTSDDIIILYKSLNLHYIYKYKRIIT